VGSNRGIGSRPGDPLPEAPLTSRRLHSLLLLPLLLLAGCDATPDRASAPPPDPVRSDSAGPTTPAPSGEPFDVVASDALRSVLHVTPESLSRGDTAVLLVATTNAGANTVSAQSGCAPGLGFRIRRPDGTILDPYADLAFICPRLDSQDLLPNETDTVTWSWAPDRAGRYELIGGLLVHGKVVGASSSVAVEVR
jgi:hypothetical protein